MRHVVFRLGEDRCALPLDAVREVVVPPDRYTRVPRAPAVVCGVMNLRGRVVTVIDLTGLLVRREADEGDALAGRQGHTKNARILLIDSGRRDLGLLVTDVEGIDELMPAEPEAAAPSHLMPSAVAGAAKLRDAAVCLLDPDGVDGLVGSVFGG